MATEPNSRRLPDDVQVSRAALSDLYGIFAVEKASFPNPWSLEILRKEFEHPFTRMFVCRVRGEVVGYVCGWQVVDELHILKIAVMPGWRRKGIGSMLMDRLLSEARERGVWMAYLEVRVSNDAAIRFYEKCGFEVFGKRKRYYSDTREDALLMKRELET